MFSVNIGGEILSSSVSQNPAHGSLQQLNVSSFVYTSEVGYRGGDTFSVQASGKSSDEFWHVSDHYQRNPPIALDPLYQVTTRFANHSGPRAWPASTTPLRSVAVRHPV